MPPIIGRKGRPRGHALTTIGLPVKRKKGSNKPTKFLLLHTSEKEKGKWGDYTHYDIIVIPFIVILKWFVDPLDIEAALKRDVLIEDESVECRPEKMSDAVVDENVDVCLVRKYFTEDAWMIVKDIIELKRKKMVWKCNACYQDLHSKPSILCDGCLLWFHFQCVSLTKQPKTKTWFCRKCYGSCN